MSQYLFEVENIKCGGCVNSIKKSLLAVPGVISVEINKEHQTVLVESTENTGRDELLNKLAGLGYPEAGNNDLLKKARSFVSCAIGRQSSPIP